MLPSTTTATTPARAGFELFDLRRKRRLGPRCRQRGSARYHELRALDARHGVGAVGAALGLRGRRHEDLERQAGSNMRRRRDEIEPRLRKRSQREPGAIALLQNRDAAREVRRQIDIDRLGRVGPVRALDVKLPRHHEWRGVRAVRAGARQHVAPPGRVARAPRQSGSGRDLRAGSVVARQRRLARRALEGLGHRDAEARVPRGHRHASWIAPAGGPACRVPRASVRGARDLRDGGSASRLERRGVDRRAATRVVRLRRVDHAARVAEEGVVTDGLEGVSHERVEARALEGACVHGRESIDLRLEVPGRRRRVYGCLELPGVDSE